MDRIYETPPGRATLFLSCRVFALCRVFVLVPFKFLKIHLDFPVYRKAQGCALSRPTTLFLFKVKNSANVLNPGLPLVGSGGVLVGPSKGSSSWLRMVILTVSAGPQ